MCDGLASSLLEGRGWLACLAGLALLLVEDFDDVLGLGGHDADLLLLGAGLLHDLAHVQFYFVSSGVLYLHFKLIQIFNSLLSSTTLAPEEDTPLSFRPP